MPNPSPLVSISSSTKPPKHFTMKVESFSLLQKSMVRYDSKYFEAGGYIWKLVLFPKGNKTSKAKGHISLYLEMAGLVEIKGTSHVMVDFKFFLLNQNKKTYLVFEDNKKKERYCFYQTIVGGLAGFDRLISLKDFTNVSNGYLIDDTCEFGVEVLVSEEIRRHRLGLVSMINTGAMYKHVWNIPFVSKVYGVSDHFSELFTAGNQKYCAWRLKLYPNGSSSSCIEYYSALFLELANPHALPPGFQVFAEFSLRVHIKNRSEHRSRKSEHWFSVSNSSWGWHKFPKVFEKDDCTVEAKITIKGVSS